METTRLERVRGRGERNYLDVKWKLMAKVLASHGWAFGLFTGGSSLGFLRRGPKIRTLRCEPFVRGRRPWDGRELNPWRNFV